MKLQRKGQGLESNNKGRLQNILVITLVLNLEDFLSRKLRFLEDFEDHIKSPQVTCQVADYTSISLTATLIDLYCSYNLVSDGPLTFVPASVLEHLMTSGNMKGFLQKYNVTQFFKKKRKDQTYQPYSSKMLVLRDMWLTVTVGIGSVLLLFVLIILISMCIRNFFTKVELAAAEFETKEVIPTPILKRKLLFEASSPIEGKHSRNSFLASPRKGFIYSPQINSTPIFSFTSPQKHLDKVVYPTGSPLETTSPYHVQPKVHLLFPLSTTDTCSNKTRKYSGNTTGNSSDKSKSLYQSRRGSSASLVIDLSPKSPISTFELPISQSPTEEILVRKSRNLTFRELREAKDNDSELHEEFWSIPPNTVSRKESQVQFSLKNRYPDILPNARSMVILKNEEKASVYVNANYISGYNGTPKQFIATQGPLACTMSDFWLMIWQCNSSIILMITKLKEKNKEKCVQYWPSSDTLYQQTYGEVTVTLDTEIERDCYRITALYLSHKGNEECRKVTHFWFTSWPDHKVPKENHQVISMMKEVQELHNCQSSDPIVVHCSAGRGRTGCCIGLALGMNQIDESNEVDILKIVSRIRIERGGLVDKDSQYKFLYKTLFDYWMKINRITSTASLSVNILNSISLEDQKEETEIPNDTKNASDFKHRNYNIF